SVCPISNCIITDPAHRETEEQLLEKFVEIQGLA
ncbi:YfhL family 4Fe-4S dicluster ferredoxin, partial [Vibrio metoecus]